MSPWWERCFRSWNDWALPHLDRSLEEAKPGSSVGLGLKIVWKSRYQDTRNYLPKLVLLHKFGSRNTTLALALKVSFTYIAIWPVQVVGAWLPHHNKGMPLATATPAVKADSKDWSWTHGSMIKVSAYGILWSSQDLKSKQENAEKLLEELKKSKTKVLEELLGTLGRGCLDVQIILCWKNNSSFVCWALDVSNRASTWRDKGSGCVRSDLLKTNFRSQYQKLSSIFS